MSYNVLERETRTVDIKSFVNEILPGVRADLCFQTSDRSRWSEEQKSNYVRSLIIGQAPSKFVFADVEKCLEYATEHTYKVDIDYYQKNINLGISFLNIDSNNRCIVIEGFFNNRIKLAHGKYNIGKWNGSIVDGNDTFETLPEPLREAFLNARITIEVYTNASREDLSSIFININDGRPLNDAEKRNAITSDVANVVRDLANIHKDFFFDERTTWFSDKDLIRRGIDDFIASFMFFYFNGFGKNANAKNLWSIYQPGTQQDKEIWKFEKDFNSFMKFIKSSDSIFAIPNRNSLFDLYVIYNLQTTNNCKIKEDKIEEFITTFEDVVGELLQNNKTYSHTRWKDPKSFETLIGGRQPANNEMRYDLIKQKLDVDSYFIQLDKKRVVSNIDKFTVAVRDNWTTPEGKPIDRSKLHDGKTYHKGHIKPHSEGNPTDLNNTVIQEADDNLRNGAKPLNV